MLIGPFFKPDSITLRFDTPPRCACACFWLWKRRNAADAELYAAAEYYFDGVWSNVTEDERKVIARLAGREKPWTRVDLEAECALGKTDLDEALRLLGQHDVIVEEERGVRFASELMRRWVAGYRP